MVNVDYFLGTAFNWLQRADSNISVRLCQSIFSEFTANFFSLHTVNKVPNMTPYRSGFPIDSIPPVDPLDPDLPRQKKSIKVLLVASIGLQTALSLKFRLY